MPLAVFILRWYDGIETLELGFIDPVNASANLSFHDCSCITCLEMAKVQTRRERVGKTPAMMKKSNHNAQSSLNAKQIYCILCRRAYFKHVSGSNFTTTSNVEFFNMQSLQVIYNLDVF